MSRLIASFKQFLDGKGNPLPGGQLFFFANKTANLKDTWSDVDLNNLNSNPVILDGSGYAPPIFGQETYSVTLKTKDGVFVSSFDDVTPEGSEGGVAFANWSSTVAYTLPAYVTGSDGCIYKATDDSTNVDPTTDTTGASWNKIEFIQYWIETKTYAIGEQVKVADNSIHTSLKNSNVNNDPVGDAGVNWQIENPVESWVTGRTYAIGDIVYGTDARFHKAVSSQSGNNPVGASASNWLPTDGVVTAPTNVLPADLATGVSRTPTLTSNSFAITGGAGAHEWSIWDVATDNGFTNIVHTSDISQDLVSHDVGTVLESATTYYMRVKYKGVRTDITAFSSTTSFSTTPDLSLLFAINSDAGTGSLRTIVTNVDLLTGSGSIWTKNRDTTGFIKRLDTARNLNELDMAEETAQAANANGLQQYLAAGFEVGTDAAYNGSGNTISSYTFKNAAGFHDTVTYTGNNLSRSISHSLGIQAGAVIVKRTDSLDAGVSRFWMQSTGHQPNGTFAFDMAGGSNTSGVLSGLSSTTFNLGTNSGANDTGATYIAEVFAHNPLQEIYCGSYEGTGAALEIVVGFPVGLFICVAATPAGTRIVDIVTGTGSHILATSSGNVEVAGGVNSFNSTGITLGSNDLNASGQDYDFIAVGNPN